MSFSVVLVSGLLALRRRPKRRAVTFDSVTTFSKFLPVTSDLMTKQSPELTFFHILLFCISLQG